MRLKIEMAGVFFLLCGFLTAQTPNPQGGASSLPPPASIKVDFQRDIAPILKARCEVCHGANQQSSGLRLDRRKEALAGGYTGPVIKPGDSAGSRLIQLVSGMQKDLVMPMVGERLTPEQIGLLRAWIDQGAFWPAGEEAVSPPVGPVSAHPQSKHWSLNPPQRPAVPSVKNQEWPRNPIDSFVLARLEAEGVKPFPEADRSTLVRRLSLDLIGLPPTPAEVDAFVNDRRPDAYEQLVDWLLASPHYGEKWARQWLDLAHYADSDGYEKDSVRPYAWKWRDWVIGALNRNLPFDQFTIDQVAGDLLPNATLETKIATGFFRNTLTNREGGVDPEEFRVEQVIDRTSTLGTVWLGLTVGCARCHDHKFDPISQKDFYRLTAFFNTSREVNLDAPSSDELGNFLQQEPVYEQKRKQLLAQYNVPELQPEWERKTLDAAAHPGLNLAYDMVWASLEVLIDFGQEALKTPLEQRTSKQRDMLTDFFVQSYGGIVGQKANEQLKLPELEKKLKELEQTYPALPVAQALEENPQPPKSHVLVRGDFKQPGVEVQPGTLAVLNPRPPDPRPSRLTLAQWLVSRENPLTARVTVNRIWQEYFGQGLVDTSADFGTQGDRPTHPELLDWLATEFIDSGWDLKHLHKLIVESATYRQSSNFRKDLEARDPTNKLLARQARFRLPAELIRDEALSVSGLLVPTIGGPSIRPPLPPGVISFGTGRGSHEWPESQGPDRYRRGLYVIYLRTTPYPELMNFDAPDALQSCTRRERSTTPLQALNLLNDPVFMEAAQMLSARIMREQQGSTTDRMNFAFRLCFARSPSPQEMERLLRFYSEQQKLLEGKPESRKVLFPPVELDGIEPVEAPVWVSVSRLLLNLDDFITRD